MLMWEILSKGEKPYSGVNICTKDEIKAFFQNIEQGVLKLPSVENFYQLHNLMNSCLLIDFNARPEFIEILKKLES